MWMPGQNGGPSKAEWAWAGVNLVGVIVAAVLFFSTDEPVLATVLLAAALIAGEFGGRAASRWIEHRGEKS